MESKRRIVLQPEYVKKFVCNGIICEDNCCVGNWIIHIDQKHFVKIKKVTGDLQEKINIAVKKNRKLPLEPTYGILRHDEKKGQCHFLTEEKMCQVQSELGIDYLWDVCRFYPRDVSKIDGGWERSLSMSCPLAAKEALFNPEPMAFEQIEEPISINIIANKGVIDTQGHLFLNKPQRNFWEIRLFSLGLLQNRKYTLGDRLTLLGIVYKKIDDFQLEKRANELPQMLETMSELIETGAFDEELGKIPVNTHIQMRIAKELTDEKFTQGVSSDRYMECLKETLLGLELYEDATIKNVYDAYERGNRDFLMPYLKENSYVLENYLVNEFFRNAMPFGGFNSIWDSYVFLCILFAMLKLHMIGMSIHHQGIEEEWLLKLIQSFSKVVLNNEIFIRNITKLIKDSELDSLAYMAILVRN